MAGEGDTKATEGTEEVQDPYRAADSRPEGLSAQEAARRLEQYGRNTLRQEEVGLLRRLAGYFWGPIPWMIEVAALLSLIVRHWADFIIIMVLLSFNALVGFWQEYQAGNAVEALKAKLAPQSRVRREGKWQVIDATELVPGDVVRLRLGDIVPADITLVEGEYLSIDESALTGESLPVSRKPGETAYSGSVVKQGEMVGVVRTTGEQTYFGKTAQLVAEARTTSHFQRAVLHIGDYLIYLSLVLAGVLVAVQLYRGANLLDLAQFVLILTVAAIPVAMPAVLSVTMAIGALVLSRMKAIVARLESIEEMAGIDILCSDKTGTLTRNQLRLGQVVNLGAQDEADLILAAALACREEDNDPIDLAVLAGLSERSVLRGWAQTDFIPFDPVAKRTEASVRGPGGESLKVSKGAPQVILDLAGPSPELRERAEQAVNELAGKGYRTLGVARADASGQWRFLGILPLYDPPRDDSAETIRQAIAHGVKVTMITGDNLAIAREISGELGLGQDIRLAGEVLKGETPATDEGERVEAIDGFAQVYPEHKFRIVKALQHRGHIVGMTGDGVNDAPALKQADVGIAVSGATDAARAAADLVLTAPGLSVIVRAIEEARRIFERMNSYAIYRITETIRIMVFMVLAMLVYDFYPITAIMIILLALLNDLPIVTIAYDNTWLDPKPVRWEMHRVLVVSTVLGIVGVAETFLLLIIAQSWLGLSGAALQSLIFLKLAVAGHLTLLVARTRKPFLSRPYPAPVLLAAILGTKAVATVIVGFGLYMHSAPWPDIAFVWAYAIVWTFVEDWAKLRVYHHLERTGPVHKKFLETIQQPLHPHGTGAARTPGTHRQ